MIVSPPALATAQDQLLEAIKHYQSRVDFLAIRLEQMQTTDILLRGEQTEALSEVIALGGQVRACFKGGWGFASFNSLDDLAGRVEAAVTAARWVGEEATHLAAIEPRQVTWTAPLTGSAPQAIPLGRKQALCQHYTDLLKSASPQITSTTVRYGDSVQRVILVTSEGTHIDQTWVDFEMRFSATARQGDTVQVGRETTGSRLGFEALEGLDAQVLGAAQRAVTALTLPKVKAGVYTVVIDPILTGLFVHEAFGHLSEADMAYENPDLLEVMSLGRRFGPDSLYIYDGAAEPGHRGSYAYDDEGVAATVTPLIQAGVLVGRLHSRETAGRLGETPTGNARCLNYHYPPIVRMTNTWIARGETPVADLYAGIDEGVYARNWLGGMTNGEMFTFTAGEAWMIREGRLAEPVRDVTLSGNVFQTLMDIEAIGDDFAWDESGGCGKGGQNGLPVGCGGPSLRLHNVVVGGE
ncbi:MAG: TldD/PmbA family protein [Gloeomargaritaceae cyanobacterium C42_A2020_066]|nr:TldD/PmbA family protein [Gloeomargaritaceae cyanobacterium C42_A2020_066]